MNAKQSALAATISSALLELPLSQSLHAQQETVELEEVIVTARKREESLQNVGLAVSVMSKTEIERTFTRDAGLRVPLPRGGPRPGDAAAAERRAAAPRFLSRFRLLLTGLQNPHHWRPLQDRPESCAPRWAHPDPG
jgi:hypothetical protein